ncbi:MAG: methylenetetrahydrofolate reductase [NAD(P)H] [Elusimicrobia bacterium]|nr:methylenetetrahydrofolate reductase [NAD(P)H] [Elusimicrobiota bacterium]
MDIPELFTRGEPVFSFEFFLPKITDDIPSFLDGVRELKRLSPSFVTLTYGAGGSARDKTIETAGRIKREVGLETACHMTCITHTKAEMSENLSRLTSEGIRHIVALRGDQPKDQAVPPPGERDFGYARDLVAFIKSAGGFRMAVAGYPETHPEAVSPDDDLRNLVEKVKAGGDWVITQLFFDNQAYFRFVEKARAAGVRVPIVPGIMPVTGYAQLKRFTAMCGASIPPALNAELEKVSADPEAVIRLGVDYAARQCRELLEGGAPGIHFYTLNKTRSTSEILSKLRKAS